MTADRPATEPRPTTHTFEQVNWDNAEQETRIGALQEMVAILLNRLDEVEAAQGAAPLPPCPICGKPDLFIGTDGKPGCPHCEVAVRLSRSTEEQNR